MHFCKTIQSTRGLRRRVRDYCATRRLKPGQVSWVFIASPENAHFQKQQSMSSVVLKVGLHLRAISDYRASD